MLQILDIPKIYTANAEWMACLAAILVYRRCVKLSAVRLAGAALVLAASYAGIRVMQYFCQEHSDFLWLFGMAGAVLIMIATIKLVLGIKWKLAFYIGARTFMWAELAASLEWQVYYYYSFARDIVNTAEYGMIWALAAYALIYVIYYLLESRHLPKEWTPDKLDVTGSYAFFAWVITLMLFAVSNFSFILHDIPFIGTGSADIFYIRTLSEVVGVVMGQMFHLQKHAIEQREENAAFQTVLRNQYLQFQESKDNIMMINRKYHDLKHQLQVLEETTNEAERSSYIAEIREGIEKYEAENKTGNAVLDTVLTSKQSRCLKENVTMTVVADGTLLTHISVMDIGAIFGNAIDHAREYEIKVSDPEKRLIHLTVSEKNSFVCVLVENYYEGNEIRDGVLPETTKKNRKYHGFGLKSVKYTCEKYGGYMHTGVRDGWFRLEMIIPKA